MHYSPISLLSIKRGENGYFMEHCKQHWMLNTPILRLILSCSLPILPAVFLLVAYDLFETGMIAKLCSSHLTALSYSAPVTTAMTGVAIAVSIATNSWICQIKAGVNHNSCYSIQDELKRNVIRAIAVAISFILFLSLCVYLLSPVLYLLLGTPLTIEPTVEFGMKAIVVEYTELRLLAWVPLVLIWQINGILRSYGYIKQASLLLISWMTTKFVLSYWLVGSTQCSHIIETGIIGAGYAHLISDTLFAFISLAILSRDLKLRRKLVSAIQWRNTFKQLSVTGGNASLQQLFLPLSIAILTYYVAAIAEDKVAILSIIFRIEAFGLLIPMVFTASLPGLIAANWWAGKLERVNALIIHGVLIITLVQVILALVLYMNAEQLAAQFSPNSQLQGNIEYYLIYVPLSFVGAGCAMLALSCLNAIGKSTSASFFGFAHKIVLTLLFALTGGWYASITGIFAGIALAHVVSLFLAAKLFLQHVWQQPVHIEPKAKALNVSKKAAIN